MSEWVSLEERLAVLETRMNGLDAWMREISETQAEHSSVIHSVDKKLDLVISRGACPAPGMCLKLVPRIESLEMSRAEAKASWKTFLFLGSALAALSSIIGGLVSWGITMMHRLK
jgi:uncharacterized coiled-coil protein SlyX